MLCNISYNSSPIVIELILADIDVDEVLEISQGRKGCLQTRFNLCTSSVHVVDKRSESSTFPDSLD